MAWQISGQVGPHSEPGYDGHGWLWELTAESRDPRRVYVQVAGTAWAVHRSGGSSLAADTQEAIATEGRSEVENVLAEAEPPTMIGCSTYGCAPIGK